MSLEILFKRSNDDAKHVGASCLLVRSQAVIALQQIPIPAQADQRRQSHSVFEQLPIDLHFERCLEILFEVVAEQGNGDATPAKCTVALQRGETFRTINTVGGVIIVAPRLQRVGAGLLIQALKIRFSAFWPKQLSRPLPVLRTEA